MLTLTSLATDWFVARHGCCNPLFVSRGAHSCRASNVSLHSFRRCHSCESRNQAMVRYGWDEAI